MIMGRNRKPRCEFDGCDRRRAGDSPWCATHQLRVDRGIPMDAPITPGRLKKVETWSCSVAGCEKTNKATQALCWMHWKRARRRPDQVTVPGECPIVLLYRDDDDTDLLL